MKNRSNRVRHHGYKISRYSENIARYKMLKHKGDTPNPDRFVIYSRILFSKIRKLNYSCFVCETFRKYVIILSFDSFQLQKAIQW